MTARLHVAMIILEYHPIVGGAQRQLALVAPLLQDLGVDITVLTRRYPGLSKFEIISDVQIVRLPAPGPKPVASVIFTLSCLWYLLRLHPDIVHSYNLFSPLTTGLIYKRLRNIPLVVKVLRGGQLGDVVRLRSKTFSQHRISFMRRRVDAFVTISHEIDAELENLKMSQAQRVFIPNGVEIDRFQPISSPEKLALRRKLSLPAGPLVIYTGRFVQEKRLDNLLKAWDQLQPDYKDVTLLLVGDGDEAASLKASAGQSVLFPGQVDDVLPYLQAADVFVLPSATEGLSNALLEAMAVGLPVIATSVGGAPDLIKDGENGRLVPADDIGALRRALNTLLGDEDIRRSLGQSARQIIVDQYALQVVAERLRSLYDSILSRGLMTERAAGSETAGRLDEKLQS